MNTWTKEKAFEFVIDYMRSKYYGNVQLKDRNMFGHALITSDKQNIYFIYKHDKFHSFPFEFPEYVKTKGSLSGLGESINKEYLLKALKNKCKLVFCYRENGNSIYTPSKQKLLAMLKMQMPSADLNEIPSTGLLKIFCDINHLIRTQERANTYMANDNTESAIIVNEVTYSFPFKLMERLK